ncbi:MlaE family ABC transporter permease [Bacteroidota bacterium]
MRLLNHIGKYFHLMYRVFKKPEKTNIYYDRILFEIENLGFKSIGIVMVISAFMGAVITIQTAYNLENPFLPRYLIGVGVRDSMLLEFSSTMVALILAGKVGSSISSELGTMRVTEQIDALEIMGVNSASFLILPKIIGLLFFSPFLTILSVTVGIGGGFVIAIFTDITTYDEYIYGIQYIFIEYYVLYALIKAFVFAFIITSISSYYGYYTSGGALQVSQSSTKAVVNSSIAVLIFNFILTQILLS